MPLLTVTGGPTAPSGETLASATLTVRYFGPYADGLAVYAVEHQAERDGTSGGWKPLGSADGTAFTIPGAGDGDPRPPECVLIERQEYVSGTEVTFRYGPLRVYATSAGEWQYGTAKAGIEFVVDADLPAATAVLASDVGVAGGVAGLDGSGNVEQPAKSMTSGTSGAPGLAFAADPDTGLFLAGANQLGISAGGTQRLVVTTGAVASIEPFQAGFESAAAPAFAFSSDPDTGMYRAATNELGFAAGGTERLRVKAAGLDVNGAAALHLVQTVVFTSSGTFTKATYPWLRAVRARVVGGGGGGAGAAATGANEASGGAGGGGGAYAEALVAVGSLAASETVTVGAGGAGGSGATAATAGGASSFGSHASAGGGAGGTNTTTTTVLVALADGTLGGTPTVGDLQVPGEAGSGPLVALVEDGFGVTTRAAGGAGGSSGLGYGAGGPTKNSASTGGNGTAGRAYGGGGGGGANSESQATARTGGAGGAGIVIVELFA